MSNRDEKAAENERAESDVEADPRVAGSRAGSDDDVDAEETGAEARRQQSGGA